MKQVTDTIEGVYQLFNLFSELPDGKTKSLIDEVYNEHKNNSIVRYTPSDFDVDKPIFGFLNDGYIRGYDWRTHMDIKTPVNEYTELYIESFGDTDIEDDSLEVVYVTDVDTYNKYHNGIISLSEYNLRAGAIFVEDIVINFKSFYSKLNFVSTLNELETI